MYYGCFRSSTIIASFLPLLFMATIAHLECAGTIQKQNDGGGPIIKYNGYKLFHLGLCQNTSSTNLREVLQLLGQLEASEGNRFYDDGVVVANDLPMPVVDIWRLNPTGPNPHVEVLVAPQFSDHFVELMGALKGIDAVKMVSEDIEKEIQQEKRAILEGKMKRRRRRRRRSRWPTGPTDGRSNKQFELDNYNSYQKIGAYLRRIAADHAGFVQLLDLGKTFEGRNLLGVKIGKRRGDEEEEEGEEQPIMMFIDAGIHAREWIAPAAALYAIDKLVNSPHKLATMFDQRELQLVFVPVANPDGYEYSRSRDRLWRKTRSRNETLHRWCVGADANRNWAYRWAEIGASRSPCSNIFPGWAPFSEPEVRAIRDYLAGHVGQLVAYISLHSYGQLILSPWGYTAERPHNFGEQVGRLGRGRWECEEEGKRRVQQKLAEIVIEAIRGATGTEYAFGSIADLLYPASGTSIDYWQHRGVPYIYGVELRPADVDNELHGFAIPPDQIEPTGKMGEGTRAKFEYKKSREVLTLVEKIGEYLLRKKEEEEEVGRRIIRLERTD